MSNKTGTNEFYLQQKFKNAASLQFTNQLNKTCYMWKTFLRMW